MVKTDTKYVSSRIAIAMSGLLLLVAAVVTVFVMTRNMQTTLSIVLPQDASSTIDTGSITLTAYSSEAPFNKLYTVEHKAANVQNDMLNYSWDVPKEYAGRDAYVELCASGAAGDWCASQTEGVDISSCAYFVSSHSNGRLASLLGWNKLTDSQKVGCVSDAKPANDKKYVSYVQALQDVDAAISPEGMQIEGGKTLNKQDVQSIVNDMLAGKAPTVQYISTSGKTGATGEKGANGRDGTAGTNGKDGKAGTNGVNGKDGTNGRDGINGRDGTNGRDGVDGQNGRDGVDGATGAAGADGRDGVDGTNGTNGRDGVDGATGATGAAGRDGVDGQDGQNGRDGVDGTPGATGQNGADGKSAYEIWLDLGNTGDEFEFIASLKGEKGDDADSVALNILGTDRSYF